uniref:Uncharacterized protein n=1 Tax=Tetranychus urticae TaxID=32264 RepID=T1KQC5_TETUR
MDRATVFDYFTNLLATTCRMLHGGKDDDANYILHTENVIFTNSAVEIASASRSAFLQRCRIPVDGYLTSFLFVLRSWALAAHHGDLL